MPLNQNSVDVILEKYVPASELKEVNHILYGDQCDERYLGAEELTNFDVEKYRFIARENGLKPRIAKVAAIQHSIVLPTTAPIRDQRSSIFAKMEEMTSKASSLGANIVCFPETWNMPFAFCTRDKDPWCEYAEDCENGPSTSFARRLAQQHQMVIISPILERDTNHGDVLWNTAVIISERGEILGKQRKNQIPHNGESCYYMAGTTGNQVFDTTYGKIGVMICFERHNPLSWMMFGLNGAEIVFNPCATNAGEHWWPIEARSAAVSNSYYAVALNRVGAEKFQTQSHWTGKPSEKIVGPFYGSTYLSAPNGCRTKSLSQYRDGILYAELDLNACQQMKEQFGFDQSQRLQLYKNSWSAADEHSFIPQIIYE